jgi:uncharacterized protein (DUF4415 family)
MKSEYDFSNAKSASQVPALAQLQAENRRKERITIRLDAEVLAWFREQVKGGGNYQTLINETLREAIAARDGSLAKIIRTVVREELDRRAG